MTGRAEQNSRETRTGTAGTWWRIDWSGPWTADPIAPLYIRRRPGEMMQSLWPARHGEATTALHE